MDVCQGFSNHYPFADQNFGKNLDPLQTNRGKVYVYIYPKMLENDFLAVYLCIIEEISTNFIKSLLFDQ